MTSQNQFDNENPLSEPFEVCLIDTEECALKPYRFTQELAQFRDQIFYLDEAGGTRILLVPLVRYLETRFKPVTWKEKLYVYDIPTGLYREHHGEIGSAVEEICDAQGYPKPLRNLKRELVDRMKDRKVAREDPFDKIFGIPVQNCILEFAADGSVTREQYQPCHYVRCRALAPYLEDPPEFAEGEKFLREISCGDPAWVRDLFRILGYCLLPGNRAQKYFVFHGIGGNGKSVLMEWVLRTLDQLAARISSRELFSGNTAQRETSIANNIHRRLLVASETGSGSGELNDELMKRLTGDTAVSLNTIYRGEEVHEVNACLILLANVPPQMQNGGKAMQRRQVCVPFDLDLPPEAQDPGLPDRLMTPEGNRWLLAQMIRGAQECIREECAGAFWESFCPRIRDDSRDVFAVQDAVADFVVHELVRDEAARTPGAAAFSRWYAREFGDDQELFEERGGRGLRVSVRATNFYAELRAHGVEMRKRMRVNSRVMSNVLVGWRLRAGGVDGDP